MQWWGYESGDFWPSGSGTFSPDPAPNCNNRYLYFIFYIFFDIFKYFMPTYICFFYIYFYILCLSIYFYVFAILYSCLLNDFFLHFDERSDRDPGFFSQLSRIRGKKFPEQHHCRYDWGTDSTMRSLLSGHCLFLLSLSLFLSFALFLSLLLFL